MERISVAYGMWEKEMAITVDSAIGVSLGLRLKARTRKCVGVCSSLPFAENRRFSLT